MNRKEIIELAEQVYGVCVWQESALDHLEQFAELVIKHEACSSLKPVQVRPWEFNMLSQGKEDMLGKPIAWSQWPNEESNNE
jgi:hypothetical protein